MAHLTAISLKRSLRFPSNLSTIAIVGVALCLSSVATLAQTPGPNRNVVSGVDPLLDVFECEDPPCAIPPDLAVKTDILLQRQNEAVIAPSNNPEHLIAAANDYRVIDIAGDIGIGESNDGFVARLIARLSSFFSDLFGWTPTEEKPRPPLAQAPEAWMGVYRSCNRGRTWVGSLLPGSPTDFSPASLNSPLRGFAGASDPVLATGFDGQVFLGGMALTRGGPAAVFVARYTDRNDREGGACFNYDFARIVESGSVSPTGKFADKPSIMADVPRTLKNKSVRYVYMAYTRFTGLQQDTNFRGNVMFSRSGDDGETWSAPKKISGNFIHNQGASIAIDPRNGRVYVVWRDFIDNRMLIAQSGDFGETFDAPAPIHDGTIYAYDQQTGVDHFRSNAFPTIVVDGNGNLFVAWQELVDNSGVPNPLGSPRIVLTKGVPGAKGRIDWNTVPRRAVDMGQRQETRIERGPIDSFPRDAGPQLQPSLAFNAGQLMLMFYEFRDAEFLGGPISGKELQMDVRVVEIDPVTGTPFPGRSSAQVSEYAFTASTPPELVRTTEEPEVFYAVNRPNLPMFRGGTASFVGDYTFLKAAVPFVRDENGAMKWAADPGDVAGPSFHAIWTGNQNVLFPGGNINGDWGSYGPRGSGLCVNPGSRDQDAFTSEISSGIVAGSPSLFKPLRRPNGQPIQRTFVVYVENRTEFSRNIVVNLVPDDDQDTSASFDQFDGTQSTLPTANDPVDFMEIFPFSTVTRAVYVNSERTNASVRLEVTDFDSGDLLAVVGLNQIPPTFPLTNTQISDSEFHTPRVSKFRVSNPRFSNPRFSNPRFSNSTVSVPRYSNPRFSNLQLEADENLLDIRDITLTVTNDGNTTSVYNAFVLIPEEYLEAVDENGDPIYEFQLLIYRTISNLGVELENCASVQLLHDEIISNIASPRFSNPRFSNPRFSNPRFSNASFYLEPAEGPLGQNSHGDPGNEDNHAPFTKDEVHWTLRVFQLREAEEGQPTLDELAPEDPNETPLVSVTLVASSTNNVEGVREGDPDVVLVGPTPPEPLKEVDGELVPLDNPPEPPDSLAFAVQPRDTQVDQSMSRAVEVRIQDASGLTVPITGTEITIALGTNPSGGTLSGTLTKFTDSGVATFDDLQIDTVGAGYTLVATAVDLGSATSAPFDITLEPPPVPPTTTRVSIRSDGGEGFGPDAGCTGGRSITPDGRYVAFECTFTNLVDDDTNGFTDVFVRDLQANTTTRVSVTSDRNEAHGGDSFFASMSYDGRFVAFQSSATDLVADDTNGVSDIFVHDRDLDENGIFDETLAGKTSTIRVSVGVSGEADGASSIPAISGDGNHVAFISDAGNLVDSDRNDDTDVFVVDLQSMTTVRLTQKSNGRDSDFAEGPVRAAPAISFDGQVIAFQSSRPDLLKNDGNGAQDIFVHDRATGTNSLISVASDGQQGTVPNGCPSTDTPEGTVTCDDLGASSPSISADGRFVAFDSVFSNLVPGDFNGALGLGRDVFLHDRQTGETSRVSVSTEGFEDDTSTDDTACPVGPSAPVLSADSRFIAFSSCGSSLVADDTNGLRDSFLHDRLLGTTVRTSVANGVEVTTALGAFGTGFTAPANGATVVVINSDVETMVSGDTNRNVDAGELGNDIFAHEPIAAPAPSGEQVLAFTAQPTTTVAGNPFSPTLRVEIQDALGSTDRTVTGGLVTLSVSAGPGALLGTSTVSAVEGVALFSNVAIHVPGSYTLRAEAFGLSDVESAAFDILVGPPAKLGFLVQPSETLAGEVIVPSIDVAVQDAVGNTVPTATHSITVFLANNPSGATLSGTTTVGAVNGVAEFDDLSIGAAGSGYTLAAATGGLASATSDAFDVTSASVGIAPGISAGFGHTCAQTNSGGVRCWGDNSAGQLGNGTVGGFDAVPGDVLVSAGGPPLTGVTHIAAGRLFTCALMNSGGVKCWGDNTQGQLGDGTTTPSPTPVDVLDSPGGPPLTGATALSVGANALYACVLTTSSGAKCWGYNANGALGNGTVGGFEPTPVDVLSSGGGTELGLTSIAVGGVHTCARTASGGVRCWGRSVDGAVGDGSVGTVQTTAVDVLQSSGGPPLGGVTTVASGFGHSCALTSSGSVKCWGRGDTGQVGDGTSTLTNPFPVDVLTSPGGPALGGMVSVAGGFVHSCGVAATGGVKCWGGNGARQLGDGTFTSRSTPVDVLVSPGGPALTDIGAVTAGVDHTCAQTTTDDFKCWGQNFTGQLGDGTTTLSPVPVDVLSGFITTVAGGGPNNLPALEAGLFSPYKIALDNSGNLYIAATSGNRVLKVDSLGIVTAVAGHGGASLSFGGEAGLATLAPLLDPTGIALDSAGNLFIVDRGHHRIRKVDLSGTITTVAGNGTTTYGGDGGPATDAALSSPIDVALDGSGNLFIADGDNHRVRKVDASGIITTVAGNGVQGFSGDGGPATSANISGPADIEVDAAGNLFLAEPGNNRIRRVDPSGIITTVAGNGLLGFSGDGGPATSASLNRPIAVAVDGAGSLYVADQFNHRVRKVDGSGVITTVAGNGATGFSGDGGPATSASLYTPTGLVVRSTGELLIVDRSNNRIRSVDTLGTITTVAGNGTGFFGGDGVPATDASLRQTNGVTLDGAGNLYIADTANYRIRKVDASGTIITFAGTGNPGFSGDGGPATSANLANPVAVATDSAGNLFIAVINRVRKVDASGNISTVAGNGASGFSGDGGPAASAGLSASSVALDSAGNLYIGDSANHRVRRVDSSGIITTVAGNGGSVFSGDGGLATDAQLGNVFAVAIDALDNLFIATSSQSQPRIRKVDASGIISTVAGSGSSFYSGDGGPATSAGLTAMGLAFDDVGNLYIADWGNSRIRKVDASGIITTIAGTGFARFDGDRGRAVNASFDNPMDAAVDSSGNIFIADWGNNRIRKVSK